MADRVLMAAPHLEPDEIEAATEVLRSGRLRCGDVAEAFEEAFANYAGAEFAYSCSSGTAALHLAYLSVIEPGDEVLVPAFTFIASASAVVLAGGKPVFCDVDPRSFTIDLEAAESRISPRTKAICAVYLFGQPIDPFALREFATRNGIALIGDAAQSLGSRWDGIRSGAEARMTAHSFYPTKNLFVGEGGMVTTNEEGLDRVGRLLRSHGQEQKYSHSRIGLNYRLTDVEAAIGLCQLPKVEFRNDRRRTIAAYYDEALRDLPGVVTPLVGPHAHHTYHQYTLTVDEREIASRDELATALGRAGVSTQVNYPIPLQRQKVFTDRFPTDNLALPIVDTLCKRVLSIPVHHNLTDGEVEHVASAVRAAAQQLHRPAGVM